MDGYTLERKLGEGSYGVVSLVKRKTDKKEFALKTVLAQEEGYGALTECDILLRLQHPNLLHGIDVNFEEAKTKLILELAVTDLQTALYEKPVDDLKTRVRYCYECASGLKMLFDNGIQHLDIKPDNVFLFAGTDSALTAKLADFGIVCYGNKLECRSDKYVYASIFRAPEQFVIRPVGKLPNMLNLQTVQTKFSRPDEINTRGLFIEPNGADRVITTKTPIWALGCLFYFILTGRWPMTGVYYSMYRTGGEAYVIAEMRDYILVPGSLQTAWLELLPENARPLIQKMFAYMPSDRPDINDVLADLFFTQAGYTQVVPGLTYSAVMPNETKLTPEIIGQLMARLVEVDWELYRAKDYLAVDVLYRVYGALMGEHKLEHIIAGVMLVTMNMFVPFEMDNFEKDFSEVEYEPGRDIRVDPDFPEPLLAIEAKILRVLKGIIYPPNIYTTAWSAWSLEQLYPLIYLPNEYIRQDFPTLASKLALLEPASERENRKNKDSVHWSTFSKQPGSFLQQALT
jgi:serine/threonine protein kinase